MSLAEVWRSSGRLVTTSSPQLNGGGGNKSALWKWRSFSGQPKRTVMWTWVCGFMLFTLGVISLFTGHVVSHLEWYSQQLSKRSLLVRFLKFQLSALLDFSLGTEFLELDILRIWAVGNQLMYGSRSIRSSSMDAVKEEGTSHVSVRKVKLFSAFSKLILGF